MPFLLLKRWVYMAIEDFYRTLTIIKKTDANNGIGGKIRTWETITTIQGCINQSAQNKVIQGKSIEQSIYKGFTEVTTNSTNNLTNNARIKDSDNKVYRLKGTPKNTMNMDHHYKLELTYHEEDNESN